jgi:hypothetical protein
MVEEHLPHHAYLWHPMLVHCTLSVLTVSAFLL